MPRYEYQCERCGIHFERVQSFKDMPVKTCPECNGPVHRVVFPVGVIFKGPGFYITDNRKAQSSASRENGDKGGKKEERKAPKED